MRFVTCLALGFAALGLAACGGGGGGGASCTPGMTAAIAINSTGISPMNVCVQPGGTVTFTNNDMAAAHDIEFNTPASCPTVGSIAPAGGKVTATFPTQENCSFHDATQATNTAFQGTVAVTPVTVMGGGY